MNENLSSKSVKNIIQGACQEAMRFNHDYICSEHILLGILSDQCFAHSVLAKYRVNKRLFRLEVERSVSSSHTFIALKILPKTDKVKKILENARLESVKENSKFIKSSHILLSIIDQDCLATQILEKLGVNIDGMRSYIKNHIQECDEILDDHYNVSGTQYAFENAENALKNLISLISTGDIDQYGIKEISNMIKTLSDLKNNYINYRKV